ncbi:MAG: hypothetical protein ACK4GN_06305 [Runella sp.]
MKKTLLIIVFLWITITGNSQTIRLPIDRTVKDISSKFIEGKWGLKVGVVSSGQRHSNVPYDWVVPRGDTLRMSSRGTSAISGLHLSISKDIEITPRWGVHTQLGYRKRGFTDDKKFNPATGVAFGLPDGQTSSYHHHSIFFDASAVWKMTRWEKFTPFISYGNRLDYMFGHGGDFWGVMPTFATLELSPMVRVGMDFKIPGLSRKQSALGRKYSKLTIEVEHNFGMMNVAKSSGNSRISINGSTAPRPFGNRYGVQREIINVSNSILIGLHF